VKTASRAREIFPSGKIFVSRKSLLALQNNQATSGRFVVL